MSFVFGGIASHGCRRRQYDILTGVTEYRNYIMSDCPRCHQSIKSQAVTCPHCGLVLKAYGHPGIPLHRATGDEPLCNSCTYHADDTCNFPQRPYARDCTLYQDISEPIVYDNINRNIFSRQVIKLWVRRNMVWLVLLGLVIFSLLLSL